MPFGVPEGDMIHGLTEHTGSTATQLPLAACIALAASAAIALAGTISFYFSDRAVTQILRDSGSPDFAQHWERNLTARLAVGLVVEAGMLIVSVVIGRRFWRATRRRDFALISGVLLSLIGGPLTWGLTSSLAEAMFAR